MESDLRRVFILVLLSPSLHLASSDLRVEGFVYVSNKSSTWAEADEYCREFNDGLITIRSEEQDAALGDRSGWIGLHLVGLRRMWHGGEELSYEKWGTGISLETFYGECAQRTPEGWMWNPCTSMTKFICAEEKLVLIQQEKTWEEAQRHCWSQRVRTNVKQWTNYDLATLVTPDDYLFASEKAQNATTLEVWTGLRYLAGRWLWVGAGGQKVPTRLPACPDQYNFCGSVSKTSNVMLTRNCMERKNFLCQRN